jgi:hypothetical protein
MAAITVTKRNEASGLGNVTQVTANCASLDTGSTWDTGLGSVDSLFVCGQSNLQDYTWTASGGIITFTVTAGPLLNVCLMAVGLP